MSENYYVLHVNEDGEVFFEKLSKEKLEVNLNENYWGDEVSFATDAPKNDLYGNINNTYIIKGEIVIPHQEGDEWEI